MMDWKSKSGASMVIALVIMILFLTIGTSVLVAATASMTGASSLMEEKRLYYFANSIAEAVTDSLENGGALQDYFVHALHENRDVIEAMKGAEPAETFEMTCTLSSDDMPEAFRKKDANGNASELLNMEPMAVAVNPKGVIYGPDGELAGVSLMTIGFTVYYGGESYNMRADYVYEITEAAGEDPEAGEQRAWRLLRYTQVAPVEETP